MREIKDEEIVLAETVFFVIAGIALILIMGW